MNWCAHGARAWLLPGQSQRCSKFLIPLGSGKSVLYHDFNDKVTNGWVPKFALYQLGTGPAITRRELKASVWGENKSGGGVCQLIIFVCV